MMLPAQIKAQLCERSDTPVGVDFGPGSSSSGTSAGAGLGYVGGVHG